MLCALATFGSYFILRSNYLCFGRSYRNRFLLSASIGVVLGILKELGDHLEVRKLHP